MAKCRILNLKPPCNYTVEGLVDILLLDFEDFKGFGFDGDNLYENCKVNDILRVGSFVETQTPDTAKYSSTLNGKIYTHVLDSFIGDLSATMVSALHLATKRRYIPVFHTKAGRYHTFGYEAGALVSYASQTADGIGSVVTITAASIYPLFEVTADALLNKPIVDFRPDFNTGAYCEII